MSVINRMHDLSNVVIVGATNSAECRKPKKAVRKAAHSIAWSACAYCEVSRNECRCFSTGIVIGERHGCLCFACLLIARVGIYNLGRWGERLVAINNEKVFNGSQVYLYVAV